MRGRLDRRVEKVSEQSRIEIYDRFEPIESLWRETERTGVCYVFQTFDWLSRWYRIVGMPHRIVPFLVVVRDSEYCRAILPLGVEERMGLRMLVGVNHSDYIAPILGADNTRSDWVQSMYSEVVKECSRRGIDLIYLPKLPELIEHQPNPLLELPCTFQVNSYAVRLSGTWKSYYSVRLDASARHDSRRRRKRLSELGRLRFLVAQERTDILRLVERMIEQKRQRYRETGVQDQFVDPAHADFYRTLALDLVPKGIVHLSALMLDDRILAAHWGAIHGKRFYHLMPSYESQWRKYSPGRLLLEDLLKWCYESGLEVLDFTGGEEKYKQDWSNEKMRLFCYFKPITWKGYAAQVVRAGRRQVRRLFEK